MSREEIIEELQRKVYDWELTTILGLKASCNKHDIDPYEDVLSPIGYNSCDRCGALEDSEQLFWVDSFEWQEEYPKDKAILKALAEEKEDYCAICYNCVGELAKKGGYNELLR